MPILFPIAFGLLGALLLDSTARQQPSPGPNRHPLDDHQGWSQAPDHLDQEISRKVIDAARARASETVDGPFGATVSAPRSIQTIATASPAVSLPEGSTTRFKSLGRKKKRKRRRRRAQALADAHQAEAEEVTTEEHEEAEAEGESLDPYESASQQIDLEVQMDQIGQEVSSDMFGFDEDDDFGGKHHGHKIGWPHTQHKWHKALGNRAI